MTSKPAAHCGAQRVAMLCLVAIFTTGCATVRNPTLDHPEAAVVRVTPTGGDADDDGVAGFFVTRDGFIVTCGHALRGVKVVEVTVRNGPPVRGEVVQSDDENDLALVKVPGNHFEWLPLFDGDLEVGMHLRAVRGSSLVEAKFDHWENFGHDIGLAGNVSAWDCGTPLITDEGKVAGVVRGSMGERTAAAVASPAYDVVKLMPQLPGAQKKGDQERKN